jgi:FkbM family methyltransferase
MSVNSSICTVILGNIAVDEEESNDKHLFLHKNNLGSATLRKDADDISNSIIVKSKPLLQSLRQHNIKKVDILKIDIEGFEAKALLPFFRDADKGLFPKFIIIENNQHLWHKNLIEKLKEFGYKIIHQKGANFLLGNT